MSEEFDVTGLLPPLIAERVISARLADGVATLVLDADGLDGGDRSGLEAAAKKVLGGRDEISEVRVALTGNKIERRVIAVGSGKGGVGKSTLTANLAIALKRAGHKVGVVDADIYGPSQPQLLGAVDAEVQARDQRLIPVRGVDGMPLLSMGQLVDKDRAMAWRGPMAAGAFSQLMEADWGGTELILIDLPPGTGDVQLTMLQKFKPDGAVIISTSQDLALIDAKRAIQLFAQADVSVIGVVENMAGYVCPHCGELSDPFGAGGAEAAAKQMGIPFLGRIPLQMEIRQASDAGQPPASKDGELGAPFAAIADKLAAWLSEGAT